MHPKELSILDYTYELPSEKIAIHPLPERDGSKLLVYQEGHMIDDHYRNVASYLPANAGIIFNNTKVVAARLLFEKATGATIEVFCLEPLDEKEDIQLALQQQQRVTWRCLVGGASKWKPGQVLTKTITIDDRVIELRATYIEKLAGSFAIQLSWTPPELSFSEVLQDAGAMPLPPYIKREAAIDDTARYQTVYAKTDGSVAAPTAGLHFTDHIFQTLSKKNIIPSFVTLHVGAGTFKPVKSVTMETHDMHAEFINVSATTIQYIIDHLEQGIIAVGTTSCRTLETIYWIGIKLILDKDHWSTQPPVMFELSQWEAYELPGDITSREALTAVLDHLQKNRQQTLVAKTQIIIAPGYTFRIVARLITNFHQPQSTLLLLVAALIGDRWRDLYQHALDNDYRFLSYGDGCLIAKS